MKTSIKNIGAALAALSLSAAAQAITVDFNSISGFQSVGPVYVESGFQFANSGGRTDDLFSWGQGNGFNANPLGNTLNHNYGGTTTTLSRVGGGTFTFNSIDLADVYNNARGGEVRFLFTTSGGSSSQTVSLDQLVGLETFSFNISNLLSVAWTPQTTLGQWLQLDNVNLDNGTSNVPEPASLALFGLALAGLASSRRKSK